MVKCIRGAVYDVMIDLRKDSDTFLGWHGEILSAENKLVMYIPEGFAHGFQTMERACELLYFHTGFYSPEYESALRFDDPRIGIKWPGYVTEISERDRNHVLLSENFEGIVV